MAESPRPTPLRQQLDALYRPGTADALAPALAASAGSAREQLMATLLEEVPAFSASGNPDILPELAAHAEAHIAEMQRLLAGGTSGRFDFVRDHARRRAEQKFPLEATLHAYRCGHRVLSRWLRDAINDTVTSELREAISTAADFAIEYTDTISTIATAEYVAQTRLQAEAESDQRSELLAVLLQGYDEADARVARLLRRSGYLDQRQAYCVAVAQPVEPREMENPARARRLGEAVSAIAREKPLRALVGLRDNAVVAVLSDTRRLSGWTAAEAKLARRVAALMLKLGPAVLIGISADAPSTSYIPKALDQARTALDFASVGQRVLQFADIPLRAHVLRLAKERLHAALPPWVDAFEATDQRARGALLNTLRAYANADLNVLAAARELGVHPNTVYTRLQKIESVTGLNAQGYHALTELLLVADCRDRG